MKEKRQTEFAVQSPAWRFCLFDINTVKINMAFIQVK